MLMLLTAKLTGEEVDMDLSAMDLDSPVLWLRLDPDMLLLRQGHVDQQDFHWRYQLRYERDITAQLLAIKELSKMSSNVRRLHMKSNQISFMLRIQNRYIIYCLSYLSIYTSIKCVTICNVLFSLARRATLNAMVSKCDICRQSLLNAT